MQGGSVSFGPGVAAPSVGGSVPGFTPVYVSGMSGASVQTTGSVRGGVPAHLLQGEKSTVQEVVSSRQWGGTQQQATSSGQWGATRQETVSSGQWAGGNQVDQALLSGAPITSHLLAADRSTRAMQSYETQMRTENESLRAEVHRLRKIENAWRPAGNDEETRVFIVNNYQHQINQNITEITNLRNTITTLQQENAELRQQTTVRDDSALVESLRRQLRELERELQRARAQLAEQRDIAQEQVVEEREHWSRIVEEERAESQRMRGRPADDGMQLRNLQDHMQELQHELDLKIEVIAELEAQLHTRPPVERIFDETGLQERDRLLEHYKFKWDEIAEENRQLKAMLMQGSDESVKINMRSELNTVSSAHLADLQREREFQTLLQEEVRQAKEEARFYCAENQRLRELLTRQASNTTEVHREVIVDHSGAYAQGLAHNPQLAPVFAPGQAELVSRSVVREERSSSNVPVRERISPAPFPHTASAATLPRVFPATRDYARLSERPGGYPLAPLQQV